MRITKDTVICFPGDVQPGWIKLFSCMEEAAYMTGTTPRSIKRSIKERTYDRNRNQWDYAWNLIGEAKSMVSYRIETQEWFDNVFKGIENLDEIEEI